MPDTVGVIIIGAGISGLALARSLSQQNISYMLYESDASLHARPQGYRVRISDEGIQALEQSLSEAHFAKLNASCSLGAGPSNIPQAILDAKSGGVSGGGPLFRPGTRAPISARPQRKPLSADRGVLRKTLLEGIQDRVVFGQKFEHYVDVDGGVVAHFEGGLEVKGSVLVGANGTWSRVRRTLMPSFTILDSSVGLRNTPLNAFVCYISFFLSISFHLSPLFFAFINLPYRQEEKHQLRYRHLYLDIMAYAIMIYVDGGCRRNGSSNAIGAAAAVRKLRWRGKHEHIEQRLSGYSDATNQRAEITAIILGLKMALGCYDDLYCPKPRLHVTIHSDSKYAVNCMNTWIYKWANNGWINSRGNDVANQDLIREASSLDDDVRLLGRVNYVWIPRSENELADGYCNLEMDRMENERVYNYDSDSSDDY
ncbi:hypothetical protein UA08_00987 [Talaromyces atroroseus]|uniref:RNase H type-1 domain-containing protein n=1 Tax=Talaromyces atroroseus TaxID=1441469 RepID=A0A225AQI4_TALAT|nr:hypothetical protein UA08_00987 [Talaromyces atroroseus]OKL63881.1 hypothetical protein UA08_00987 [Talaromyces atroroseus]